MGVSGLRMPCVCMPAVCMTGVYMTGVSVTRVMTGCSCVCGAAAVPTKAAEGHCNKANSAKRQRGQVPIHGLTVRSVTLDATGTDGSGS